MSVLEDRSALEAIPNTSIGTSNIRRLLPFLITNGKREISLQDGKIAKQLRVNCVNVFELKKQ